MGAHPYFRVGDTPSEDLTVTVSGRTYYPLDEAFIPTGRAPVEGTQVDLRAGKPVREAALNSAFTDLELVDGAYRSRLTAPTGDATELWGDEDFAYVQVFTQPSFPGLTGTEFAVAMEPMTAPANALATGSPCAGSSPAISGSPAGVCGICPPGHRRPRARARRPPVVNPGSRVGGPS
nr:hypothetical protein [Naasia aerilata]